MQFVEMRGPLPPNRLRDCRACGMRHDRRALVDVVFLPLVGFDRSGVAPRELAGLL